jgi:glycosyltransferase 2 family protein
VPKRALAAVATVEMLLAPVLAFAVGSLLLLAGGADLPRQLLLPLAAASAALLVLASPPVVDRALRWRAGNDAPRLPWPALLRLALLLAGFWLWSGSVFALYVAAFPGATSLPVAAVVGAYAVAWGVGWLAVFAPQGVGVTEAVLAGLLAGGSAGLALVLGGYRALIAVRDLGGAALATLLERQRAGGAP